MQVFLLVYGLINFLHKEVERYARKHIDRAARQRGGCGLGDHCGGGGFGGRGGLKLRAFEVVHGNGQPLAILSEVFGGFGGAGEMLFKGFLRIDTSVKSSIIFF